MPQTITDRIYLRPPVDIDALLDALYEACADVGTVATGNSETIANSIKGATAKEIDENWARATARRNGLFRGRSRSSA